MKSAIVDLEDGGALRRVIYPVLIIGLIVCGYLGLNTSRESMIRGEGLRLAASIAEAQRLYHIENGSYRNLNIFVTDDSLLRIDARENSYFREFTTQRTSPESYLIKVRGYGDYSDILITVEGGLYKETKTSVTQLMEK